MPNLWGWGLLQGPHDDGATWHAVKMAQNLNVGTVAIHTVCGQVIQGYDVPNTAEPPSSEPVCEPCRAEVEGSSSGHRGTP